jgi:hypothetical protein
VKEKEVKQGEGLKIMNRKEKDAENEQNRRTQQAEKCRVIKGIVSRDDYFLHKIKLLE